MDPDNWRPSPKRLLNSLGFSLRTMSALTCWEPTFVWFCIFFTHCFYFPYSVTYPRGYRTKFNKGRIHPEVWPLILLNTIFDIVINISNMRCSVSSPDENTTRSGVFLNELRGVSSCDETLRLILDITSQTEWFKKEHFFHLISNHSLNINFLCILLTNC